MSDQFNDELEEVRAQMRAVRVEMARLHMIDHASKTERDAHALSHFSAAD